MIGVLNRSTEVCLFLEINGKGILLYSAKEPLNDNLLRLVSLAFIMLNFTLDFLASVSYELSSRVCPCVSGQQSKDMVNASMILRFGRGRNTIAFELKGLSMSFMLFYIPFFRLLYEMDSQQATHTIRSHGLAVARTHMHDWLILSLLAAIMIILNLVHPFRRFVGKDMMGDLKYPLKDSTIPFWTVPLYAVFLPMLVFLAFYFRRRDVYDLHHAILGLLFSVFITGVLTEAIKDAVGRPRPDFFWRCFPNGIDLYDEWGDVICHGDISVVRQGHKSFPSGHTSWSFAGLGFLSLYLSGKIRVFDRKGHAAKLCIVFLPLLVASLVGISRVDNYRHHWQDVFAGALIGITVTLFCYLQFFAPPYHTQGWGPYAFFGALEMPCANSAQVSGPPLIDNATGEIETQLQERNNISAMGSSLDDLESGRCES